MPPDTVDSLIDLDEVFLPVGSMRQIERITHLTETGITGEMQVGPGHWVYGLHFPGDPIFPGCLMIEAAGQLVAARAWHEEPTGRPRLARAKADFKAPVGPQDDRLVLSADVRRRRHLHFAEVEIRTTEREVARVDVVLAVVPSPGALSAR